MYDINFILWLSKPFKIRSYIHPFANFLRPAFDIFGSSSVHSFHIISSFTRTSLMQQQPRQHKYSAIPKSLSPSLTIILVSFVSN
ncbi:hypothetical protein DBK22_01190 [Bacillus velezensis]|nr:hypothetical protein BHE96_10285 [Bacillus subtilis]MCP1459435.1 hypothetical protein [Bacillus amyloliquefaciens]MCP1563921.1 hypothetical protein [Bacillus velezensis]ODB66629.1 hypothetical protein A7313_10895 [Bacillus velezensis]QHM79352.1 hypothetical protein DBK22_01190 [Bacillus velezensis]